jgi:rubredoxin
MKSDYTIKINFRGGIISPGDMYNILVAASKHGIHSVSFGLRQQLFISVAALYMQSLCDELKRLDVFYEVGAEEFPNIVSSYPAEEIFINHTWLSEGVYKDILDSMDHVPKLKINISDSNQSFTPLLTGNINWVASTQAQHFWHLFVRFPKTNVIYEWDNLTYTNDVAALSKDIELLIFQHAGKFVDNMNASGIELFDLLNPDKYITRQADKPALLPAFNLPYYEGLNRYNNKYWLGIYRRDELFGVEFLKSLCRLCLDTKIGQLCSTPWKSIIVKSIEEKDRIHWNHLLERYQVNVRHAANELNFQVEDNSEKALEIKKSLVKALSNDDTRTFGLCIGIKTKSKSEIFSSILVRRRPLFQFLGTGWLHVYDILCAHDFNPNERTGFIFSRNNPKILLAEQLRRTVIMFYGHRANLKRKHEKQFRIVKELPAERPPEFVYQCKHCLTVYDEKAGEPDRGIAPGTFFSDLPTGYCCSVCDSSKQDFIRTEKEKRDLHPASN